MYHKSFQKIQMYILAHRILYHENWSDRVPLLNDLHKKFTDGYHTNKKNSIALRVRGRAKKSNTVKKQKSGVMFTIVGLIPKVYVKNLSSESSFYLNLKLLKMLSMINNVKR